MRTKRIRVFSLILAVSFLLSLIPSSNSGQGVHAQGVDFAVSGYVTDGNGTGLSGIKVYAEPKWKMYLPIVMNSNTNSSVEPSPDFPYLSALTDSSGFYDIGSIPNGDYILRVDMPGVDFMPENRPINGSTTGSQDFAVVITPAVINEKTVVLTDVSNQFLSSSEDLSTFTFSQSSIELDTVNVGDIIVSAPCVAAPNGYLRKVIAITLGNSSVILGTEAATLEEAIEFGSAFGMQTLNPSGVTSTEALPGVEMTNQIQGSPLTFFFNLDDVVISDLDGNPSTTWDQLKANGSIEFEMDFVFYLDLRGAQVRRFSLTIQNTLRDTLELSIGEIELASLKEEAILATQFFTPITLWVGPVPLVFVPKLDLVVGVDGSVKVGISTEVSHELSMKAGIQYQYSSGWSPIAEVSYAFSFTPPHVTLDMTLKGYFGNRFNLYLYGLAGPYVKITPYLEIKVEPLEQPWWTLYGGVDVPVGFRVIHKLAKVLDLDEYEVAAIGVKQVIAQASTVEPGEMVYVPAGQFQMGCDPAHDDGTGCISDELLHTVWLDAFIIDKTEVTNAQYQQCVAAGACNTPSNISSATRSFYFGNPDFENYPVIYIDWYDAEDYCNWANKRLPTEAEWEKAARGTTPWAYPWGDGAFNCNLGNSRIDMSRPACVGDTTAVGSYPAGASPYGALDMAGNVLEWVSDWHSDSYYSVSPYANPSGPSNGTYKGARGGSFSGLDLFLLTFYRWRYTWPTNSDMEYGFRCVSPAGAPLTYQTVPFGLGNPYFEMTFDTSKWEAGPLRLGNEGYYHLFSLNYSDCYIDDLWEHGWDPNRFYLVDSYETHANISFHFQIYYRTGTTNPAFSIIKWGPGEMYVIQIVSIDSINSDWDCFNEGKEVLWLSAERGFD